MLHEGLHEGNGGPAQVGQRRPAAGGSFTQTQNKYELNRNPYLFSFFNYKVGHTDIDSCLIANQ